MTDCLGKLELLRKSLSSNSLTTGDTVRAHNQRVNTRVLTAWVTVRVRVNF